MDHAYIARTLVEQARSLYAPEHAYAIVSLDEFKHLDRKFYLQAQHQLEALGFRWLGDIENITTRGSLRGLRRKCIRVLVSDDGRTTVAISQLKTYRLPATSRLPRFLQYLLQLLVGLHKYNVVEFESELQSGAFINTHNFQVPHSGTIPDTMQSESFESSAPLSLMHKRHLERLTHLQLTNLHAVVMHHINDVIRSQQRMHARRAALKKEQGLVTRAELDKLPTSQENIDAIYREVQKLLG